MTSLRPVRRPAVVAVVGPTAVGKSHLALALARRLGGEIVNADSMQLYEGMDVGTAKPGADERAQVRHHLLDVWPVTAEASVADYQRRARDALARLQDSGTPAVLVGGSGLYVRAALDDLRFPPTDPGLRAELEAEAAAGPGAVHARLAALDPGAAAALDPANVRRVVRALEVVLLTGAPFRASLPAPGAYAVPAVQVGLRRDRADLDRRIDARVAAMFAAGLVDEVRGLIPRGLREGRTASRALGYAQVLDRLDRPGPADEAGAAADTAAATRRFARRQESWFGRDPRVTWFDAAAPGILDAVSAHVGPGPGRRP